MKYLNSPTIIPIWTKLWWLHSITSVSDMSAMMRLPWQRRCLATAH